ncbi:hypothetical protein M422DRAFT_241949 [Sphaerobolus stellatus SS14]|nr:hypothetical protein M422DRAFT_241949 [Sphaerobolus stellatus SS14]
MFPRFTYIIFATLLVLLATCIQTATAVPVGPKTPGQLVTENRAALLKGRICGRACMFVNVTASAAENSANSAPETIALPVGEASESDSEAAPEVADTPVSGESEETSPPSPETQVDSPTANSGSLSTTTTNAALSKHHAALLVPSMITATALLFLF